MKTIAKLAAGLCCVAGWTGCMTTAARSGGESMAIMADAPEAREAEAAIDRMLVRTARIGLRVAEVGPAVGEIAALVERQQGYIEQQYDSGEKSANVIARIPADHFQSAVEAVEALGEVTHRRIEGKDVTEQYVDIDARLKNRIALRDRLKQLLEKAADVKDILAIETELNRVQSDIDSMEARMQALRGRVDFATIAVSLERKPIPGPLGYLFRGLWWGVEKLFVIRD